MIGNMERNAVYHPESGCQYGAGKADQAAPYLWAAPPEVSSDYSEALCFYKSRSSVPSGSRSIHHFLQPVCFCLPRLLFPELIFQSTLYENLLYGNNRNIDEKQILDLMKELNLFKESHNYNLKKLIDNKSLSSGQMQKIAFIRALLSKPDILLLDEAVSNLDDSSKSTIFDLLKVQKVTIINSTHDPTSYKSVDMEINIEIIDEKRTLKINS